MDKKWLLGGAAFLLLAGGLLYWWPALADTPPSTCPVSTKCIFNDNGPLLIQTQNGDIDLKIATATGAAGIYFNRRSDTIYGLAVKADGTLLHNGYPVVIADGGTYNITSNNSKSLGFQDGEFLPSHVINQQIFAVSDDPSYFGFTGEDTVIGLSSIYSYSYQTHPLVGQLAFVRKGTTTTSTQQLLKFRFNDSGSSNQWGPWLEICDTSNNCHNFINLLDDSNTGDLLMYQDPDLLMSSGLKITSTSSLVNCTVLSTVSGEITCGTSTPGGGDNLGSHIATQNIQLNNFWLSGDGGEEGVFVSSTGYVGIGTNNPSAKLHVNGAAIINGTVQTNLGSGIVTSNASGTLSYVSDVDSYVSSVPWSKLTGFPSCTGGQYVTGLSSSTLTCGTPTSTNYTAGAGLTLTDTTFSLASSGTSNYITKWTGTNTLGNSTIYDNSGSIGIGTTGPATKLHLYDSTSGPIITLSGSNDKYRGLTIKDTSNNEKWFVGNNTSNNFVIRATNTNDILTISSGNVGIGTSSPGAKLAVQGDIQASSLVGTGNRCLYVTAAGVISATSSDCGSGSGVSMPTGTTGYILRYGTSAWEATSSIFVAANGNVGIGVTSNLTDQLLRVEGDTLIKGDLEVVGSYNGSVSWSKLTGFPSCTGGQYVQSLSSSTLTCGTPTDNDTTYTAGAGLNLNGTTFSVKLDGTTLATSTSGLKVNSIGSDNIIDGSITNNDISTTASIAWSKITKGAHSSLTDLNKDDHQQYVLLAGRSTGQTIIGGTEVDGMLTLQANSYIQEGGRDISPAIRFVVGNNYMNRIQAMTILQNGNVGIIATSSNITLAIGDHDTGLHSLGDGYLAIYSNNQPRIKINPTDSTGITVYGSDGSTTWATLKVVNGTTTLNIASGSGKIDAGTVDPLYTIGGKRYATYMSGMTGVKEETSGVLTLDKNSAGLFMAKLDFIQSPEGSDLWLFGRTTNIINNQEHFNEISCLLTPNFSGETWYEKDWGSKDIIIFARPDNNQRERVEVSYRLTAPRFDNDSWNNYSSSESEGFNLDQLLK